MLGEEWVFDFPFQMSKTHLEIQKAAPDQGSDSDDILVRLGYDQESIAHLRERGGVQ